MSENDETKEEVAIRILKLFEVRDVKDENLRELLGEAVYLLKRFEFVKVYYDKEVFMECPECGTWDSAMHKDNCEIGNFFKKIEGDLK